MLSFDVVKVNTAFIGLKYVNIKGCGSNVFGKGNTFPLYSNVI